MKHNMVCVSDVLVGSAAFVNGRQIYEPVKVFSKGAVVSNVSIRSWIMLADSEGNLLGNDQGEGVCLPPDMLKQELEDRGGRFPQLNEPSPVDRRLNIPGANISGVHVHRTGLGGLGIVPVEGVWCRDRPIYEKESSLSMRTWLEKFYEAPMVECYTSGWFLADKENRPILSLPYQLTERSEAFRQWRSALSSGDIYLTRIFPDLVTYDPWEVVAKIPVFDNLSPRQTLNVHTGICEAYADDNALARNIRAGRKVKVRRAAKI